LEHKNRKKPVSKGYPDPKKKEEKGEEEPESSSERMVNRGWCFCQAGRKNDHDQKGKNREGEGITPDGQYLRNLDSTLLETGR